MIVPNSLKFIMAGIAVMAIGFVIFLFYFAFGVIPPLIVFPIWVFLIFMLLLIGLVVQGLEK